MLRSGTEPDILQRLHINIIYVIKITLSPILIKEISTKQNVQRVNLLHNLNKRFFIESLSCRLLITSFNINLIPPYAGGKNLCNTSGYNFVLYLQSWKKQKH